MALSDVLGLLAGSFGAGLSEYGAEQQRRQELARKRAEEERIRQATQALFRGGDVTPELAGAAITAGVSPTVVGSAQMFGRRQEVAPDYMEGVNREGYKYRYDPATKETVTSPFQEYRAPREPQTDLTPGQILAERGRLQTDIEQAQSDLARVLRSRPSAMEYPSQQEMDKAWEGYRAESTTVARRVPAAEQRYSAFVQQYPLAKDTPAITGVNPLGLTTQVDSVPTRATQLTAEQQEQRNQLVQEAVNARRRAMLSGVSDAEKAQMIQNINERLRLALRNYIP